MKLRLFLFVFSLFAVNIAWAQSKSHQVAEPTVGIGRLQVSLNDSIPLYHSADEIRAFDTLVFSKISSGIDQGRFTMSTKSAVNVVPFLFSQGDSYAEAAANVEAGLTYHHPTLVFRVVSLVKGGFEVVLNEKTFETCVIKKDKKHTLYTVGAPYWASNHSSETSAPAWFLYESWGNYFKRLAAIKVVDPKLYNSPDGTHILSPRGDLSFQVVYAIEQWVKVRLTGEQQKDGVRDEVWLRWTDGRNLLVTPIEEIYY